jgi:hypothetical protein
MTSTSRHMRLKERMECTRKLGPPGCMVSADHTRIPRPYAPLAACRSPECSGEQRDSMLKVQTAIPSSNLIKFIKTIYSKQILSVHENTSHSTYTRMTIFIIGLHVYMMLPRYVLHDL